jgi:hypothetical protein
MEAPEPLRARKLPDYGMQVRWDYVAYAHFEFLRRLLKGCQQFRFYLDQDRSFRNACRATFDREIRDGRFEAFYMKIATKVKRTAREALVGEAWAKYDATLKKVCERIG